MVDVNERLITVSENLNALSEGDEAGSGAYSSHVFTFDHVYDQNCNQKKIYDTTARSVVESSLQGYNATIFAYGQTGTGKTYTMEGFNSEGSVEERGIIPRAIEQIFQHIQSNVSARKRFLVRASYLQIYNEQISDLLKPERNNLSIREDKKRGVFVEGLSEWVVRSPPEIYGLMERGGSVRATGSTKMNEISSRSHAVFIIIAEQSQVPFERTLPPPASPSSSPPHHHHPIIITSLPLPLFRPPPLFPRADDVRRRKRARDDP
jgi:kinesin family protein 3/17